MNKVLLMGRLTKDPEIRVGASSGNKVATFTVAIDRTFGKEDKKTDFVRIKAFTKKADFAESYLRKGTKIVLCGRLEQEEWTARDGSKRESFVVTAEEIEFAESKKHAAEEPKQGNDAGGFVDMSGMDDELPFSF